MCILYRYCIAIATWFKNFLSIGPSGSIGPQGNLNIIILATYIVLYELVAIGWLILSSK